MTNNTKRRAGQAGDIIAVLAEFFPVCFKIHAYCRQPLKRGVHLDMVAALKGAISDAEIKDALRAYTGHAGYLSACREGASRVDLNGTPVETVTAGEAAYAAKRLARSAERHQPTPTIAPRGAVEKSIERKPAPRQLSLADLRAAARARREMGSAS